jgi:RsiW-degrading membrane proteinase PrsW (M82 family)
MLVYVTLVACALIVGGWIWRYDLYEREPWYMVVLAAALGFGVMRLVGAAEEGTIGALGVGGTSIGVIAAVAATHEELAKLAVVAAILIALPGQFNDPLDGILYGSIVGLGMAVEESIFYLGFVETANGVLPTGEMVRLLGHPIMGGIGGFALGMIPARRRRWPVALAGGLVAAVGLHFLWNYVALRSASRGGPTVWTPVSSAALMASGMLVYGALVSVGARWSQRIFDSGQGGAPQRRPFFRRV